ncbi:MAG: hypothetical protein ABI679_11235, partial [Gemmatimonadota bacterium]
MSTARIDDSTVVATLPGLPSGSAAIEVVDGSKHYALGSVSILGFREQTTATPGVFFEPVIVNVSGEPVAVAGADLGPSASLLGMVRLRLAQTSTVSGVRPVGLSAGHGVGPTFNPDNFILEDSAGNIGEWQLFPTLAYVDTVPSLSVTNQVARLAPGVWIFLHSHQTDVRRSGAADTTLQIEDPWRTNLSTAADRALLSAFYPFTTFAPVFEMSTGNVAYSLPLTSISGVAWSANGATMFVVGDSLDPQNDKLFMLNASTGAPVASASIGAGRWTSGVALSSGGNLAFVGALKDTIPEVVVFAVSNNSLTLVGRLPVPPTAACPLNCNALVDAALTVDDAT